MTALISLTAVVVGVLIGAVGAGGVLIIPALNAFAQMSIHAAMGTALFSFIFTGTLGTYLYQRQGSIQWAITLPICASTLVFSYLGALTNGNTPETLLQCILGGLIALAGGYALIPSKEGTHIPPHCKTLPALLGIGAFVGFCSGLTGAGGPVISVPLMVLLGFPPLLSIATSQVIQITAGISGSVGNFSNDAIDFTMAWLIIVFEVLGVVLGVYLAHSVSKGALKKMVGIVCMGVGTFILVRALVW